MGAISVTLLLWHSDIPLEITLLKWQPALRESRHVVARLPEDGFLLTDAQHAVSAAA